VRIYVSGPISGHEDGNLPLFRSAELALIKLGYSVVVPHDCKPHQHSDPCPTGYGRPFVTSDDQHTSTACFIRGDFRELLTCDAIYLLRNWECSVGARAEFDIAALSGMKIYYQHTPSVPRAR